MDGLKRKILWRTKQSRTESCIPMTYFPCPVLSNQVMEVGRSWSPIKTNSQITIRSVFCLIKTGYRVLITIHLISWYPWCFRLIFLITFDRCPAVWRNTETKLIRQSRNSSRSFSLQSRFWDVSFWYQPETWCLSVTFQHTLVTW